MLQYWWPKKRKSFAHWLSMLPRWMFVPVWLTGSWCENDLYCARWFLLLLCVDRSQKTVKLLRQSQLYPRPWGTQKGERLIICQFIYDIAVSSYCKQHHVHLPVMILSEVCIRSMRVSIAQATSSPVASLQFCLSHILSNRAWFQGLWKSTYAERMCAPAIAVRDKV